MRDPNATIVPLIAVSRGGHSFKTIHGKKGPNSGDCSDGWPGRITYHPLRGSWPDEERGLLGIVPETLRNAAISRF